MKKISSFLFILILFLSLICCKNNSKPDISLKISPEDYPRVDGSTATIPLAIALRSAVTSESKDVLELSTTHSKTTESFRSLQYDSADLLIVYSPSESVLNELKYAGIDIIMKPIGRDALVFFTNESNSIDSLTQKQVQDIYMGNITNWKDVGGPDSKILAFQRDEESGSQVLMQKLVMQENKMVKPELEFMISEMGAIIETVADYNNDKNALGYSVYYYISAFLNKDHKIKLLKANGVMPSNNTIKDGSYPYTQDFYAVIKSSEPESSETRKLFDFLVGEEGKKIITETGYVALDD